MNSILLQQPNRSPTTMASTIPPASPPRPISLLSAMLNSPPRVPPPLEQSSSSSSASTSAPQTLTPGDQPASILRRASVSDDPESVCVDEHCTGPALKFAMATCPPSHLGPPLRPRVVADGDEAVSDAETDASPAPMSVSLTEYPFARPTNYRGRRPSSPRIAPVPVFSKGEGHVQVADPVMEPRKCSRHCSPPPTRSRSGSVRGPCVDAGPREGRAGSPMPDVGDWEDEEDEEPPTSLRRGSLPAVFGPSGSVFRRASEHLPGYRPSIEPGTSMSLGASNALFVCPPALDPTPALARSVSPNADDLTVRLEMALSSGSTLSRARSLGSKATKAAPFSREVVHAEL